MSFDPLSFISGVLQMPQEQYQTDLPPNVFTGLIQESAGLHASAMGNLKQGATFDLELLRKTAIKKFDEPDPTEAAAITKILSGN